VTVTPSSGTWPLGYSQQLTATGAYSDGSTRDLSGSVNWTSSSAAVQVSASGMATAKATGSSKVTAAMGSVNGASNFTVTSPLLVSISVQPASASVDAGTTQQFTATGTYSDGSSQDLTSAVQWKAAASAIADVSASGLALGKTAGLSDVIAAYGSVSGSAALTVNPASLVDIAVSSDFDQLPIGATAQFTATGIFSDGSSADLASVQWSSSDITIATVDASGVATGVSQGPVNIVATSGAVSSSAPLTILPAVLLSIAVTPGNSSIARGTTQQFTAVGTFSDGSTQSLPAVTWSAQPSSIAAIDVSGLASAEAAGNTVITASAGAISGSTSLTVTPAALTSIAVNPPSPTIPIGVTQQFVAVGTFSDNSTQDISALANWTSSNGAVAQVNASGLATSLTKGVSTVTATLGAISGSATLTVSNVSLTSISVSPVNPTVAPRTVQQFVAIGHFNNGSTTPLTGASWRSSSPRIANMRSNGVARAKHTGSATITATWQALSGSTVLTVSNANLVSIAVTPIGASASVGSTQQFTATGTFDDNHTQDMTLQVHWSSSSGTVATVSNTFAIRGLASALAPGTTNINASTGVVSGFTPLVVNPGP
jgi:uncharacterized protein YjdB